MDTSINADYQEKIDSYILGEMNDRDAAMFENELSSNRDLYDQYLFTLNVKKGLEDRNRIKSMLEECNRSIAIKNRNKKRALYSTISGIAAIAIFGFFLFNHSNSSIIMPELNNEMYSTYRGNPDLQSVASLIMNKQYETATSKIDSLDNVLTNEISQLTKEHSGEEEKDELMYFLELQQSLRDELMWLKLYALVGVGDKENAKKCLFDIKNSDSKYKLQADSIYNKIK